MKFGLLLATLVFSQVSFGATPFETKLREKMLERTDLMIKNIEEAREDLAHQDVVGACAKIKIVFELYPDHLNGIGGHMSKSEGFGINGKAKKAADEALDQLQRTHLSVNLCKKGVDSEYVDAKVLRKELKETLSSLEDNRKVIKKLDLLHENKFDWSYGR